MVTDGLSGLVEAMTNSTALEYGRWGIRSKFAAIFEILCAKGQIKKPPENLAGGWIKTAIQWFKASYFASRIASIALMTSSPPYLSVKVLRPGLVTSRKGAGSTVSTTCMPAFLTSATIFAMLSLFSWRWYCPALVFGHKESVADLLHE